MFQSYLKISYGFWCQKAFEMAFHALFSFNPRIVAPWHPRQPGFAAHLRASHIALALLQDVVRCEEENHGEPEATAAVDQNHLMGWASMRMSSAMEYNGMLKITVIP